MLIWIKIPEMKNLIFVIVIAAFTLGCADECEEDYEKFENFMEPQGTRMLKILNHSFDTLLQSIYADIPEFEERLAIFLEDYSAQNDFPRKFSSDSSGFRNLKLLLESSGLRKDVYLYEDEFYENKFDLNEFLTESEEPEYVEDLGPLDLERIEAEIHADNTAKGIEIAEDYPDSVYLFEERPELSFYMNPHGKFWYGLGKYSCNVHIFEIIESVKNVNRISLGVVAGGMQGSDFSNPFIKEAIMAQFYIPAILRFGYTEKTES